LAGKLNLKPFRQLELVNTDLAAVGQQLNPDVTRLPQERSIDGVDVVRRTHNRDVSARNAEQHDRAVPLAGDFHQLTQVLLAPLGHRVGEQPNAVLDQADALDLDVATAL